MRLLWDGALKDVGINKSSILRRGARKVREPYEYTFWKDPIKRWDLAKDLRKVPINCWDFAENLRKVPINCWDFAKDLRKVPINCWDVEKDLWKVPINCWDVAESFLQVSDVSLFSLSIA